LFPICSTFLNVIDLNQDSNGVEIDKSTIVEVWKDWEGQRSNDTLANVTAAGYRAILAAPWYLNYNSYGVDWDKAYVVEPTNFNGTKAQKDLGVLSNRCSKPRLPLPMGHWLRS